MKGKILTIGILILGLFLITNFTLAMDLNEAPMLEEKVKEGELPPVEERVPQDPYIVDPVDRVGDYGGTASTASLSPSGTGDDHMMMEFFMPWVQLDPETKEIVPHLAKEVESSKDKKVWTVHLREGVKWSDGEPYNADDIMFWYEDILLNEELTPAIDAYLKADGKVVEVKKVDDLTAKFIFATPRPYFKNQMTIDWRDRVKPKHYLKKYHPNYVSEKELDKKVKEEGFNEWYELFEHKSQSAYNAPLRTDLPTLAPYKLESISSDRRVYVRNPYFWKVDSEGNQLPYIDKIETDVILDREVYAGKIMSGQLDFAGFETLIQDYSMYKKNEEEGGYRTLLWESGHGNEVLYQLNMTHKDESLREIFQDIRFRKALSLGIDREEINEVIYYGNAQPRQYTVIESSEFFKPEYADAYIEYNPEKANALLDEMGLDKRDESGYRLKPNGERLSFTIEYVDTETAKTPNIELVTQHWQELGLDVAFEEISGELAAERVPGNLVDASLWHGSAESVLFPYKNNFIIPTGVASGNANWPEWANWWTSDGERGEEPIEKVKQLLNWYEQVISEPDTDKRLELGHNILESQAENLWVIGTIGNAPHPIIVSDNLKNIRDTGLWGWEVHWSTNHDPSQFFLEQ